MVAIILLKTHKTGKSNTIDHIAIWTKDLELLKNFYCKNFDAKASDLYRNTRTGFSSYFIKFKAGTRIELMHKEQNAPNNKQNNWGHISIYCWNKETSRFYNIRI